MPPLIDPWKQGAARSFFWLLLAADLVFVVLHLAWATTPWITNSQYSLQRDRGYPEMYQYIKEFWAMLLLAQAFRNTREGGFLAWAAVFAFLLADDALFIHERVGEAMAHRGAFMVGLGLESKDLGELVTVGVSATVLLGLVALFYVRGSPAFRRASQDLAAILLLVALFGVAADLLHRVFQEHAAGLLLGVVEDGGEMVAISVATWYAFVLGGMAPARRPGHAQAS